MQSGVACFLTALGAADAVRLLAGGAAAAKVTPARLVPPDDTRPKVGATIFADYTGRAEEQE